MNTQLPELPRILRQREANSSLDFRRWIESNPQATSAIEMKDTRGKEYLPFSAVEDEQINYALAIKHSEKGVLIRVVGLDGQPDFIYLRKEPAFVVIKYPSKIVMVDIDAFVEERDKVKRKSLTFERAIEIGFVCD